MLKTWIKELLNIIRYNEIVIAVSELNDEVKLMNKVFNAINFHTKLNFFDHLEPSLIFGAMAGAYLNGATLKATPSNCRLSHKKHPKV
jgi:hypothetical protein